MIEQCWAGEMPAEALTADERDELVAELHRRGWADSDIAQHTRMTTYTTERIRTRLGLAENEGSVA